MLSLSCPSCRQKLQVKPLVAGEMVRCSQCKQALDIPPQTVEDGSAQPAYSDCTMPSQPMSDVAMTETVHPLPSLQPASEPDTIGVTEGRSSAPESVTAQSNYEISGEIGRGGMGAVMRGVDDAIRREVAVKFLLNSGDVRQKARFFEEAQITGQLEHPNIVPIHQLGVHRDGSCFFSMKMVKGRSLAEMLREPRKDETLGRLLNVFLGICNAVAYAHSRRVIHRDLKPANIMVGDFGEVYVMDWGLAKVLSEPEASATNGPEPPRSSTSPVAQPSGTDATGRVATNRQSGENLTQTGAVLGTPVYMPPEQAQGKATDERSDIYSLGAILYEMMTLTPPVGRGGDTLAILLRVVEGRIEPPQVRAPQRAREGWVPAELSAIALKAVAREPADRYATVAELRRDIELFVEGRSVSAKHDSVREQVWKLIKRNKGASIATAVAAAVLLAMAGFFLKVNYDARLAAERERNNALAERKTAQAERGKAERAYADYQREQNAKEAVMKRSIPAMLRAARQLANEGRIAEANDQVALALTYDPQDPEGRLLKGQILLSKMAWAAARVELEANRQLRPDGEAARSLLEKLADDRKMDTITLYAIAELLQRQQLTGLAMPLLAEVQKDVALRKPLADSYRKQLEANWPGLGIVNNVRLAKDGRITLSLANQKRVTDLSPLRGMHLDQLSLADLTQIKDLGPLAGMLLKRLSLHKCRSIEDISPLQGMPLTYLNLEACEGIKDFSCLQGMPLDELVAGGSSLKELSPLRGLPLTILNLERNGISDLGPLKGMKLTRLSLGSCQTLTDLSPLQGMPLTALAISKSRVNSLEALKGMPLTELGLPQSNDIRDLTPLRGMPLQKLTITGVVNGKLEDLAPLEGMPLRFLDVNIQGQIQDLSPLQGMPLKELHIHNCRKIEDLSPLSELELQSITIGLKQVPKMEPLRKMKSLSTIIVNTQSSILVSYAAEEFWRRYDAGEFK